ncbi:MAG: thiamine pyrophosphate-binding protein [Chloroflexota bacterium]|nr:thiamine pyrophosphate-binding protein [Chloroflexota bacterium]
MRGGDAVVKALEQEGVRYITGFSGGGLAPLWPALRESTTIRAFATRHERLGVEVADGYARATGEVGVAMAGVGPGATNTLTGIASCFADNVPVLLLMGQHPLRNLGKEYQQEISSSIFDTVVKWKGTFTRADEIPGIMRRAFTALRSGSPGPVVLEMPQDVMNSEVSDESFNYKSVGSGTRAAPDMRSIEQAAELLVNARYPILNAGGGTLSAGASEEVKELAELLSMPVATTLLGKSVFPEDHPLSVGGGVYPRSRYASGPALHVNRKADVVLAVGNSFRLPNGTDGRPIPEGVKLIHINADEADLNKIYQADVPILADAKLALRDLIEAVKDRLGQQERGIKPEVAEEIKQAKQKWLAEWLPVFTDGSTPTNGYRVIYDLMQVVDPHKTIAIHDAGGSRGYIAPFWVATHPRSFVAMGGMAPMGWSLGAAIGAKLARPDHLVVHLLGDASFGMTGMDIETAVRMGLPTLTIVINNQGIGGGMMGMDKPGGTPPEVAQLGGNFSEVAKGLGAYSERVETPQEIIPAYRRAIESTENGKAALVEVMIKPMKTPDLPDDWSM